MAPKGGLRSGFLCYSQENVVVNKDKCYEQTECDNQGQTKPSHTQNACPFNSDITSP